MFEGSLSGLPDIGNTTMLLNTWLTAARHNFFAANSRRFGRTSTGRALRTEALEGRTLLSAVQTINALVINQENVSLYRNASGGLDVDNTDLTGKDALVIEGITVSATSGNGINVNLSGINLKRFAIESVVVAQYSGTGIGVSLTNVTGLDSVAIEDVTVIGTAKAVDVAFNNSDTNAFTIDDSVLPGITVTARDGADIHNGVITENTISAGGGVQGVVLNVLSTPGKISTANSFRITDNVGISSRDDDAIVINATGYLDGNRNTVSELDGLTIANNRIGTDEGARVFFRAEGDTFVQPFVLTNNSRQGELLQTFVFDLSAIGLQFDIDPVTGKPFTALGNSGTVTGVSQTRLLNNNQTLEVTFADFNPGETLQFVIDIDLAGGTAASIFGNQLIGADVDFAFSGNKVLEGQMTGDPSSLTASQFLVGSVVPGGPVAKGHGIHIKADMVPVSNLNIFSNVITGTPGHGVYFNTQRYSDITGQVTDNEIGNASGNGILAEMRDSNFYGGIDQNKIALNDGYGIELKPLSTRSGRVREMQDASAGRPVIVTTVGNHNLNTGDQVMIQGVINSDTSVTHPANGLFTVTVIDNLKFSLQGTETPVAGAIYGTGGEWYVPDFRGGLTTANAARGFVQIDLKPTTAPRAITGATNSTDIVITSAAHGLKTGDQIRISDVQGNTAANGTFDVTVLSVNTFMLKGMTGNGNYTLGGSWIPLAELTPSGDRVTKGITGNSITNNGRAGIFSNSPVGTTVRADINLNEISQNLEQGVQFLSRSYGLGTSLPLDVNDPNDLPAVQDYGFDVNIGAQGNGLGYTSGGNRLDGNHRAGIAIEALDYGTGGFEIWNNTIISTVDDGVAGGPYTGDGIFIRLDEGVQNDEATAILAKSVIKQNVIGVDNEGNDGHGLYFLLNWRTKIQDLEVVENNFLNNGQDGFHFERLEDARLNSVIFEKNRATNNAGDGFDLYANNTSLDRLDFQINDNRIEDNAAYGLRVFVEAAAKVDIQFDNNSVVRNGHTPNNTGYHPNDGVAGSTGVAGGVGFYVRGEGGINFSADSSVISNNTGDGVSIDALEYSDSLIMNTTLRNSQLNNNTLTGFRSQGAAFGTYDWFSTTFNGNGEDGARIISVEDQADFYRRRIGAKDLDVRVMRSTFDSNRQSGLQLGMGTNGHLGDGTALNSNSFSFNVLEDGLKITQSSGPFLEEKGRRRTISAEFNTFTGNGGDGIDIGHFTPQEAITQIELLPNNQFNGSAADGEAGNPQHGDEVVTDIFVSVSDAIISGNAGDGVEWLGDSIDRVPARSGGGQDIAYDYNSGLSIRDSRIINNGRRGIDILNRRQHDSFITIANNRILSNRFEGIYVVNTASHFQRQNGPNDPLDMYLEIFQIGQTAINPNIELRVQENLIESNGTSQTTSTVPINDSLRNANDDLINPHIDHTHRFNQVPGTLGGLVIRVGTAESVGTLRVASTLTELGLSGVDAEIWKNSFNGNFGSDVYFDNYVSQIMPQARDIFQMGTPSYRWLYGYRDPLSRFDLSFRENTGNSLDVINGFAFYDNWEGWFKSRLNDNSRNPWGDFINAYRKRNATRTVGYQFFNDIGVDPTFWDFFAQNGTDYWGPWSYDGLGTTTWRIESDFDFNNFVQTNTSLGFSDFFDVVNLQSTSIGEIPYQWDTGIDTPSYNGRSSFSLDRGDIFNFLPSDARPIGPDAFEDNDGFASAKPLAADNPLTLERETILAGTNVFSNLTIETKADRDYYMFTAADNGPMSVVLDAIDTLGDRLQFMIYEVNPVLDTEEVPMFVLADLTPNFRLVNPGATGTLSATVVQGRDYIIEVVSDEFENVGSFQPFRYGTTRNYSLTVTTPNFPASPGAGSGSGGSGSGSGSSGSSGGSGSTGTGGSGGGGSNTGDGGSLPGKPTLTAIGPVSPDPRTTSSGTVRVRFNEDVSGVDITDFTLTRDSLSLPLTGVSVTQVTAMDYDLGIGDLTGEPGVYVLTLNATNSNIQDGDTNKLDVGGSETWVVNSSVASVLDTADTNPGNGVAADINGLFTLRAAIMESNASAGTDVIQLGASTYTLTRAGRFEDDALLGDLDIRGRLTIRGVDAKSTIIDGALLDRVFHVFPGAILTLENLTIRNGSAFDGGGIFNQGTLNLRNVNVILNVAANQGGGIFNAGTMNVTGSAIAQNVTGSRGGGVNNTGTASYLNTTISSNLAVSRGGGIFNENAAASTMLNVSIIGNEAGSRGGGLAIDDDPQNLVADNTRLGNTLIERNATDGLYLVDGSAMGREFIGELTSLGYNQIQVLDRRYTTATSAGLQQNTDTFGRQASPLADASNALSYLVGNGVGAHALKPNGAAVDRGSNALYPTQPILGQLDAVGNPRLIEGNGDGLIAIDIGAVEHFVNTPVAIFVANPNPAGLNEIITFNGLLSTHPNPAVGSIQKWEWDFDWNPTNQPVVTGGAFEHFTKDAEGSTATHAYIDGSRTEYTVRLIVTDNFNNVGFMDLVVKVGAPTKPVVQRPFARTTDLTPEIRWTASPANYRLEVFNVSSGTPVKVLDLANLTSNSYTPASNLPLGNYEVVVTASNASGTAVSNRYSFTVERLNLVAPANTTFDVTPKFTWNAIPNTQEYDLWVSRLKPTYVQTVLRPSRIDSPTYEATTSLGLGEFVWWVRAIDSDGVAGAWSLAKNFTIGRPTITSPGIVTMDSTPTISWTNMGAPRYELWVNKVGGQAKIIHQTALTTTSYTPTTALPNGDYDVWVRPLAADGEAGLWSLAYRFRMDYRIGPVPISPVGISTDTTPTFTWQAMDSVSQYDLWVDNLSTGARQYIRVNVNPGTGANVTYTHPNALPAGNYRWWVQGISTSGSRGAWSPATDFTVPVPAIVNPRGAITTNLPLFTWNGVAEYVRYDLWVDNLTTGTKQVLRVQDVSTRFYQTTLPFENGTFRAWIRAFDAAGNVSQWSGNADFTIAEGIGNAPRALSPSGVIGNNTPSFFWQPGFNSNAATYELLVKRIDQASQPVVINVQNIVGTSYTTTTTLAPGGTYRWWVRGVASSGSKLPWSQPLDFRVVSSESSGDPDDNPLLAGNIVPVVLTVNQEIWSDELGIRSITAHPAATIVQVDPGSMVEETAAVGELSQSFDMPAPEAFAIDSLMEEWSLVDLLTESEALSETVTMIPATPPAVTLSRVEDRDQDHEFQALNLLMAGLIAATIIPVEKKQDEDQKI
jgi:hypothetical protein